jgi:hypothetical protein
MTRLEEVKTRIEEAFADVPYPGDRNIGSDPDYWECAEINEHFRGRHWREIPRDILQYHQHDLPFFSPAGLRYYLPTYLLAGLDGFVDVPDFTVYDVEPDEEGDTRELWIQRYEPMTPKQKQAIRMWLEYLRDERPRNIDLAHVQAALEKYWGRDWEVTP